MKKILILFPILLVLIGWGCAHDEDQLFADRIPTLTVSVSPETIEYKGSSIISWKAENTEYVLVNNQKMGTNDSMVVEGLTSSTLYTITAIGDKNRTFFRDVMITVGKADAPTVNITSPSSVPYGTSTSFSWVAADANSIILDGSFVSDSGSFTTPVLYESKEYTLVVEGPGGKLVQKIQINVLPQNRYTISTTCGKNGSVLPGCNLVVTEGEDATLTFKPEDGFEMNTLKVDGVKVPLSLSLTLENVTSNKNVEVTFKKDSILWPLLHIVWRLKNIEINGNPCFIPDGEVVNYYIDGTYTILEDGKSRTNNWTLDRSISPFGIDYGGPKKLEKLDNEQMIITYINGYNQVVKYCFVNERYK